MHAAWQLPSVLPQPIERLQHELQPFLKFAGVDLKSVEPKVVADIEKLQRMFRLTGHYRGKF